MVLQQKEMKIPTELIPQMPGMRCSYDNEPAVDGTFVEDEGWHAAAGCYNEFIRQHKGEKVLFLELGVGANTPVIIKYPFWRMTVENPKAVYACVNYGEAFCPGEIEERSICLNMDIQKIPGRYFIEVWLASCTRGNTAWSVLSPCTPTLQIPVPLCSEQTV